MDLCPHSSVLLAVSTDGRRGLSWSEVDLPCSSDCLGPSYCCVTQVFQLRPRWQVCVTCCKSPCHYGWMKRIYGIMIWLLPTPCSTLWSRRKRILEKALSEWREHVCWFVLEHDILEFRSRWTRSGLLGWGSLQESVRIQCYASKCDSWPPKILQRC